MELVSQVPRDTLVALVPASQLNPIYVEDPDISADVRREADEIAESFRESFGEDAPAELAKVADKRLERAKHEAAVSFCLHELAEGGEQDAG